MPPTDKARQPGGRDFGTNAYIIRMNKLPSPERAAKQERQRLAAEDGSKALQEVAERASAVRQNMARLRELRLAKEAADVRSKIAAGNQSARPRAKKPLR